MKNTTQHDLIMKSVDAEMDEMLKEMSDKLGVPRFKVYQPTKEELVQEHKEIREFKMRKDALRNSKVAK